ncbi:hypothetical protein M406DRAFT_45214 [Cryphonectria parasitica EP155]|uniref:Small secreted protein n=1 Tax=Cryphonectria parasitica (strain ATCC 38755 / EP155) TaxID=660469 RepID=A0A9P4Y953_CRYP1|nr:uncharacterized protein M406DRAFT_45214 [Cryphonectria parasitica EP155]KAF3769051.1 hypothetical protein M406DRAFT_45214 [Cryphonectria parasitica EP155]
MYFKATVLFSLAASALALPASQGKAQKRAGVLTASNYADFQVSDGVGGNALAEIDTSDLANVDPNDLAIIKAARVTAEDAETDTGGFDDAIDAASGATADALSVGKTKNKVLKLQLEVLGLQIDQAQSGTDNTAKIAAEQTKLNTNIANDKANAGQTSQSVDFQGTSDP